MTKEPENGKQLERLLCVLSAATFLVFFQAYLVAPLIPRLSRVFDWYSLFKPVSKKSHPSCTTRVTTAGSSKS
jgi:hypothetical protein